MKNEVRRVMGAGKPTFTCRCHLHISVVYVLVLCLCLCLLHWLELIVG